MVKLTLGSVIAGSNFLMRALNCQSGTKINPLGALDYLGFRVSPQGHIDRQGQHECGRVKAGKI